MLKDIFNNCLQMQRYGAVHTFTPIIYRSIILISLMNNRAYHLFTSESWMQPTRRSVFKVELTFRLAESAINIKFISKNKTWHQKKTTPLCTVFTNKKDSGRDRKWHGGNVVTWSVAKSDIQSAVVELDQIMSSGCNTFNKIQLILVCIVDVQKRIIQQWLEQKSK